MNDRHPLGTVRPCPVCTNLLKHSRLNMEEQAARLDQIRGGESATMLRHAGKVILDDPFGWFVVWGGTGSAKTLFLQALVAEFCRRGVQALYYHARDLQDGLYRDIHDDDSTNGVLYRRVPVLAIDELDKWHFTEWSRTSLQAVLDDRYRNMGTHVTLFASNRNPLLDGADAWLPDDIRSRMVDGRFRRVLPALDREIEGVYEVAQVDMRPMLRRTGQE